MEKETDHAPEVVEAELAHGLRNLGEPAYRRMELFQRRRALIKDWARYLAPDTGVRSRHT